MILNIVIIILFVILFILGVYFNAYLQSQKSQLNSTNSFFHINQNTPFGYSSSNGILGGYQDILETSNKYEDNMESGTITQGTTPPQQEIESRTCLDAIEDSYENDGDDGVWDQMECDQWWLENIPGVFATLLGIAFQVGTFVKITLNRMSAAEWFRIKKKMTQLNLRKPDGSLIRNINDLTPNELSEVLNDPQNNRGALQFQNLCENDPDFKKFATKNFKISTIPKSALLSINDFQSEFGDDFKIILKNKMPGVDIDRLVSHPNSRIPISMSIKKYDNIDINSSIIRTKNLPGLDFEGNVEADYNRKLIIDEVNKDFKGIKTVDDMHYLSRLPDNLPDDQKTKIYNMYQIDPDKTISQVRAEFSARTNQLATKNVFPSYQTFSDGIPSSRGLTVLNELKEKYETLYPPDNPDSKPFRGTSSLTDMFQHPDFDPSADTNWLKRNNLMDPNVIAYRDGPDIKFGSLELEPHNMVPVSGLTDVDFNISNEKLLKLATNKGDPEKLSKFKDLSFDLNVFNTKLQANGTRPNKNIMSNLDLMDDDLFRKLQDVDVIPPQYLRGPDGKLTMADVKSNIEVDTSAKIGKFADKFDDGGFFSKGALADLKSSMMTSTALGAGLGVGMGLATKDMYDEDDREDLLFETSAMVIGSLGAEAAEWVVERGLRKIGNKIGGAVAGSTAGKAVSKYLANRAARKAQSATTKGLAKTAGKKLAQDAGKKLAKKGAEKVGKKMASKAATTAGKSALKGVGKAVLSGLTKLAGGPIGAVLLVIDIAGLVLDLIDPCGFESKIKKREQWEAEFKQFDLIHRQILKSMGKSYPGQAKPDLLRYYTVYDPLTGEASQKMNKQDKKEYDRYYDSYFEKCNLITDASCRDNTFSSMALNAIRQGRMQAVNNLDTNMINPYSIQPVITDKMKVGDAALYSRVALTSNLQVTSALLDTTRDLVDGRLVASTERINSQKIELKPLKKILAEEFNSKAVMYYIVSFLFIVISIVLTIKLF